MINKEEMDQKESFITVKTVNYEDFSYLCRTCLGSLVSQTQPARLISDKFIDLHESDLSIGNLLKVYTTLDVASEDNKPQSLCCTCLDELLRFHTFREMSLKNEEILNKAIQLYNVKNNGEQDDFGCFMDTEENEIICLSSDENGSIQDSIKEECLDDADDHDYINCNNEIKPIAYTKESPDDNFKTCMIEYDDNSLNNDDESKDYKFNESDNSNLENDDEIDNPDDNVDYDNTIEDDDSGSKFFKAIYDNFGYENDIGDTSDEKGASSDDAFVNELPKGQKYKCEHCDLEFEENKSLVKHEIKEHPLNKKKEDCKVCGRMIFNTMMDRHMKRHERAYECDVCLKKFTLSYNLIRHKKLHSLNKSFMCNKCNKGFYRQESLNNHLKIHDSKEGNAKGSQEEETEKQRTKYSCDICKKGYSSLGGLKKHKATHGEKNFLCPICGQAFYHNTNLNFHIRTHTGEKPYECTLCEKRFTQKTTLEVHMIQHTGIKPHRCNICEKTFAQVPHLKRHMLSHTGIKPHQCNICKKSFAQLPHLKQHLLTHTGEKPFSCDYCDKRFSIRTSCLAHMRAHAGIRPYVCEICGSSYYDSGTRSKHIKKAHPDYS